MACTSGYGCRILYGVHFGRRRVHKIWQLILNVPDLIGKTKIFLKLVKISMHKMITFAEYMIQISIVFGLVQIERMYQFEAVAVVVAVVVLLVIDSCLLLIAQLKQTLP